MLDVSQQVNNGQLVCPKTRRRLTRKGDTLVTEDGAIIYPMVNGVPILIEAAKQNE
jgi:uncharacterized protein YbaR (Trm112 family)